MKSASIFVAIAATLLVMSGCAGNNFENNAADSTSNVQTADVKLAPAANKEEDKLPERQFIRTSDMKFRVRDVTNATNQIEHIVRQNQGFVTYTNLKSTVENQQIIQKSLDSSLESIQYAVTNEITLRIPNAKLDSTLYAISSLVDFWDYRIIKADDVALQIKANQQAQSRALNSTQNIHQNIDRKKSNLNQANDAVSIAENQQEAADNAALNNISLKDQVTYSTVSLSIYQRTETRFWSIASPDAQNVKAGIGIRVWDSIKTGWYFAEDLFVGIIRLWFVILLIVACYLIYRKYFRKKVLAMWK
ncbi:DUF4349 domain-containing protein [Taibaiella lutea]|uniref:DUF4349 domain-containing protein n=1 Tax=Taibaiella lutea TaxID=2608001 RepID=A0A5M6CR69_9BACT|nr:DUF4349 domain-containing protein [Taibaiella lutea]KAA5537463.1 DUF4349 domain-containing protein [Taibaiella lutea]